MKEETIDINISIATKNNKTKIKQLIQVTNDPPKNIKKMNIPIVYKLSGCGFESICSHLYQPVQMKMFRTRRPEVFCEKRDS